MYIFKLVDIRNVYNIISDNDIQIQSSLWQIAIASGCKPYKKTHTVIHKYDVTIFIWLASACAAAAVM